MKKIIVLGLAVLAAVVTNAASVNWKTSLSGGAAYADSSTVLASATAYLIDTTVLSQDALASAISGGKSFADAISGKTLANAAVSAGKINNTFTTEAYAAGENVSFYVAILNGDNYYASDSVSATVKGVGDTTVQFKLTAGTKADGAWKDATGSGPTPTPEPTSGLLLLVGGAMLALRRRRA